MIFFNKWRMTSFDKILIIIIKILLTFSIIIFFLIIYKKDLPSTPFYSDEVLYPCMGNIFLLIKNRDWFSKEWRKDKWYFTTSPINRYLYGAYLDLSGNNAYYQVMDCEHYGKYGWKTMSYLTPQQKNYLFQLRDFNIYITIFVLAIGLIIFWQLFGSLLAIAGVFILGFNPLFRLYATRSMAEMTLLAFISLGLLLLWKLQKSIKYKNHLVPINILLGICFGFTMMVKPYGALILIFSWILLLVLNKSKIKQKVKYFIIGSLSCLLTMILLYPPFFTNPFSIIDWFKAWIQIREQFQTLDAFRQILLPTPLERISSIIISFLIPGKMTIFSMIALLNLSSLIILIALMIYKIIRHKFFSDQEIFIFCCFIGFFISTILYLQINFDRYYLPLALIFTFLNLYSIKVIIKFITKMSFFGYKTS